MKYRQYTECVQPEDYTGIPIVDAVAAGLFATVIDIAVAMIATGGLGGTQAFIAVLLGVVMALLSRVHWELYGRLICLGGEKCAIGMVVSVEPPEQKTGLDRLDSDYSFNLLLPPYLIGDLQETIQDDGLLGRLILEHDATKSRGLPFEGETARDCKADPATETAVLHCEFEGAGMHIFYQWLKAMLAILSVAAALSLGCIVPGICDVAFLLAIVALLGVIMGMLIGMDDVASPSDVDPELGGSLHLNDCKGRGADLLAVSGEWVYDSLHDGWNEIHPVRHCQRIGTWEGNWPFDAKEEWNRWCGAIGEAHSPLTGGNQNKPENQWEVHPDIDGCDPGGYEPPR